MSRKRVTVQDRATPTASRRAPNPGGSAASDPTAMTGLSRVRQSTLLLSGLLLGLVFHFTSNTIQSWFPQDDSLAARNSLLVSQQLDQMFRKIDEGVAEDPSRLQSYMGLLEVFYVYDRRFVEQNEGSKLARVELANAAQRLGLCAKVLGDIELSKSHYRQARETLDEVIDVEPMSVALFQNLLEVQTTIAELEQSSGNSEIGRREFDSALGLLKQMRLESSEETNEWMAPLYKTMATLAIQMQLFPEAHDLAVRYIDSVESLMSLYPTDEERREQVVDAKRLMDHVDEYFQATRHE